MQVIKTEAYFDDVEAPAGLVIPPRPGIGVGWIDAAGIALDPSDLSALDFFGEDPFPLACLSVGDVYLDGAPQVFAELVNAALWDCPLDVAARYPDKNTDGVAAARKMSIAVASSPRRSVPFIDLLAGGASRIAGTILGWRSAGHERSLALVTRPEGLLLIGSAAALKSALEQRLERSLKKLFAEKKSAPRRW